MLATSGCEDSGRGRGPTTEPVQSVPVSRVDVQTGQVTPLTLNQYRDALVQAGVEPADLSIALLKMTPQSSEPNVVVVKLPKTLFDPVFLVSDSMGTDDRAPNRLVALRPKDVVAAGRVLLGSTFVTGYSPLEPLGLLQVDGVVRVPVQPHGYTRLLGVGRNGLGVVHRSKFERGLFEAAIQAGPGVVEGAKLDINPREQRLPAFIRSFVGTCQDHAVIGVTLGTAHLYDLGQRLVSYFEAAGLACDEVVNLSGDRETLLVLPDPAVPGTVVVYGNLAAPKTLLIGFDGKDPARL